MIFVPIVFAMLSVLLLIFGVILIVRQKPAIEGDDWRDRPPVLFRVARPIVNLFAHKVASSVKPYQLEVITDKLFSAGMGYTLRPEEFIVTRRIGLAVGLCLFLYVYLNINFEKDWHIVALSLLIPLGYFYPDIWLRDTVKRRQSVISKTFPFFLDLLVLSMRAGLNFSSSLAHSVEKMPEGPVRNEFSHLLRETRTGVARKEALIKLARRIQIPAISNFVSAVNQAEETGGELGRILLSQAEQRRSERFLHAEKLANQAPVKMLAPLIGILFPMTFIIIVFPIFIKARDSGAMDFLFK